MSWASNNPTHKYPTKTSDYKLTRGFYSVIGLDPEPAIPWKSMKHTMFWRLFYNVSNVKTFFNHPTQCWQGSLKERGFQAGQCAHKQNPRSAWPQVCDWPPAFQTMVSLFPGKCLENITKQEPRRALPIPVWSIWKALAGQKQVAAVSMTYHGGQCAMGSLQVARIESVEETHKHIILDRGIEATRWNQ